MQEMDSLSTLWGCQTVMVSLLLLFCQYHCDCFELKFRAAIANVTFDSNTTSIFLNHFCRDPDTFSVYVDMDGNFYNFIKNNHESRDIVTAETKTYDCNFDTDGKTFSVHCAPFVVRSETFNSTSSCFAYKFGTSQNCTYDCAYVWLWESAGTRLTVDVGQCDRTEPRFATSCTDPGDNTRQSVTDESDSSSVDPFYIISMVIIFLQSSIIAVYMGFVVYIDIL